MDYRSVESTNEATTYQEIADSARAATGAVLVLLARLRHEDHSIQPIAWSGLDEPVVRELIEEARRSRHNFDPSTLSYRIGDTLADQMLYTEGRSVSAPFREMVNGIIDSHIVEQCEARAGIRFSFATPLTVDGCIEGVLSFHTKEVMSDTECHSCEAFARQAALAMENAGLLEALQRQLQEVQRSRDQITAAEERSKREIAELLHGRVQTRLLIAWHRLGECLSLMDTDPAEAKRLLEDTRTDIDQIREHEIRDASHILHPSIITLGLVPALHSLASRFECYFPISIHAEPPVSQLDTPLDNRIPEPLRLTAYRVVEEALTNSVRHAMASKVDISLEVDGRGRLVVSIEDDGRGVNTQKLVHGLGLNSIAARVDQARGNWRIMGAPGHGTRLTAYLPLGPEALAALSPAQKAAGGNTPRPDSKE